MLRMERVMRWGPEWGVGLALGIACIGCGDTERNKSDGPAGATSTEGTGGSMGSGGGASGGAAGSGGGSATASGGSSGAGAGGNATGGSGGSRGGPARVGSLPLAEGELDKLDVLFVVDNSISTADKQALFQTGVPTLVERLINPICVSLSEPSERALVSGPNDACPSGFEREFEPLTDVHAGIITSSLGSHGGDICSPDGVSVWDET